MRGSRMKYSTGVWCFTLLLVSTIGILADEDPNKNAKIGIKGEERLPISDHEYPRENIPKGPEYRGPGHWATPAPDSGIELGFIPIKTYSQVRRSISVKHLPRSDALASATTPEEKLNAPRLREVVTTKKISEVYTEEGYEDSAYDHGGYKKEKANVQDYVKPAASNHQDSVAQGTNAIPKPGLQPGTWERHKVIRNETRMMFLGDKDGKETVPMKVVASYSHTIQHPDVNGDIVESGSINMPLNRKPSTNRRSSKVPRSSPHFTENLAIPVMQNDASIIANHHLLAGNRHSEVSHPPMVQNYPAVIMQHNSEESNLQLLMRNQQPVIDYSSLMQNPAIIQRHPSMASNAESLPISTQNVPSMFMADPLQQTTAKLPHQLTQNLNLAFLQNSPQVKANTRSPPVENLPMVLLPSNPSESQNLRLLQQISDNSQIAFLSQAQPRSPKRGNTRLTLVQDNSPALPSNRPRDVEISLHYKSPPVIIESDTPPLAAPRFPLPVQQRLQIYPGKPIAKTRDDFLTPPPQYQLTSRELVAFAKSNRNSVRPQGTPSNEINTPIQSLKANKVESKETAMNKTKENDDHTTERTIITNGHLPWGVIANEARKIAVSKLVPLKDFSDDDESPVSTNNSQATSITKIIKPSRTEDNPKNKTQKTTKPATDVPPNRPQKANKHMEVYDPRKNDTYPNELPHLAKFVEALTLAHYAPNNEHPRDIAFKSSGRKHNAAKHADRNKDLQDMLAKVYANKQKSIHTRGKSTFAETRPSNYRRATIRYGGKNTQVRQPQVEHIVHPGFTENNFQQTVYDGMGSTNLAVNRAPRISRKADSNFQTKDIKYLSGDKEEARLAEEERLLEKEKDKELEENVAQWKQAILEIDNPKPEVDIKKYPFYHAPITKSISPYSPLRYATNPKDIPKKTEGGMEFYESRENVQCPEVVVKLDVVPKRAKSGEWNKKPKAKLPRLRGLGDKIDCLKIKYFGEEPLDNPFFKETIVGLPKSTSNRRVERISEAEDEIENDPLGLYADILKHVQNIGNSGNFPLYSSSNHKSIKPKQRIIQDSASSNQSPESVASYNSGAEKSSKGSTQNMPEALMIRTHADTHQKPKNKNLDGADAPYIKANKDNYTPRQKRPLPTPHRQQAPYKQHPRVSEVHSEQSKRVKEDGSSSKKESGNIQLQSGFRPLILNPTLPHGTPLEQRQKANTNGGIHRKPKERPHGEHYGVSPHPHKTVSPAENGTAEAKVRKDYNNIIGMQPPPIQKHRANLKTARRKPKEYPASVTELLPGIPKAHSTLKRIKDVPELLPLPLQYRPSADGRIILVDGILASDGFPIDEGALQHQHIDEILASESVARNVFKQRSKRSAEFSEESLPRVPLDVNDAAPLLQRRQDHVVVDRLGNMYYGHVNGDDAFWTTAGNDIEPNEETSHTTNALHDANESDDNDERSGEPRYKTHDGEYIGSYHYMSTEKPQSFDAGDKFTVTKKPNYNSIISLSTEESRFGLSSTGQAVTAGPNQDSFKEEDGSVINQSNGKQEIPNARKGLPLTEAQSTPEVLSPEQINRILSGIMTRHSYSSRYRSEENPSSTTAATTTTKTTTTTTTTTEKPITTSPRSNTKSSRKRPAKKHRVIPILNGRVIPELITSTTKSPDIKKLRRRLPAATTTTSTTTEASTRGTNRHQRPKTSRRGKSLEQESSTARPNTRKTGTHRRKPYNGREHRTDRKFKVAYDKENNTDVRATRHSLNSNTTQSNNIVKSQQMHPQANISHKTPRIVPTSEPDSTTVPPQRVQAIETRRVTKEEIFTTRYYPQHAEDEENEDTALRDSNDNKHGDEDEDDDDKEIYEPYASQHFHSGNHRNSLHRELWNEKSKVNNKKLTNHNTDNVHVQSPHSYFTGVIDEQETETVEIPEDTATDEDDAMSSTYTVFPQDREEFKDVTVLTYVVHPNTGMGKWIPGTDDSAKGQHNRKSELIYNKTRKDPSASNSDSAHEGTEESDTDAYYSEDIQEAELFSSTEPSMSLHIGNSAARRNYHHYDTSIDEASDTTPENENDNDGHREAIKKVKPDKLHKVLQKIPKDKLISNEEEIEDNLSHQDDKTATDLYVLVSLLPTSDETTEKPVKYVKHPGERKYYYVQDYTDNDSANES